MSNTRIEIEKSLTKIGFERLHSTVEKDLDKIRDSIQQFRDQDVYKSLCLRISD